MSDRDIEKRIDLVVNHLGELNAGLEVLKVKLADEAYSQGVDWLCPTCPWMLPTTGLTKEEWVSRIDEHLMKHTRTILQKLWGFKKGSGEE